MAAHVAKTVGLPEGQQVFSEVSQPLAQALEEAALTTSYPDGAVLFVEEQTPRGVYVVRHGRVKLSVCARDGKVLILRIAEAGEVLGAAAAVSGRGYEATAETQGPCEIAFIRQSDLQRLMRTHAEMTFWVAQHLSRDYNSTCREIRNLMLSSTAREKLARLIVGWLPETRDGRQLARTTLTLTHEEIGQMIGTSRETVTRLLATFKRRHLIEQNGCTLVVPNRMALESLITA